MSEPTMGQSLKTVTTNTRTGMTLAELRTILAEADRLNMPDTARIKVRVGYSGQIRSLEVIHR